ncbi:hypothetical protein AAFM46_10905 [Arthrobacter sp. TMP15]|uniref:hypothetical protein n=1 Tax=Arthrobacter sp. TMP15 TaxID=3140789 RepID=UPI0031BBC9A3
MSADIGVEITDGVPRSDLRNAVEELAAKCRMFSTYEAFTPGARSAYGHMLDDLESILDDFADALAAHPDNSATEWGVQWNGEDDVTEYEPSDKATVTSAFKADIAWAKRNVIRTPPKGELVSRQVTPWERTK